jgi:hypothetical protein
MEPEYGEETLRGYQFLEELIYYMIDSGVREYRLKRRDIPLDYSVFPFEIVRFDKILKVLELYSTTDADQEVKHLTIVEPQTGRRHRFSFRPVDGGEYLRFTLEDD